VDNFTEKTAGGKETLEQVFVGLAIASDGAFTDCDSQFWFANIFTAKSASRV
jgi:hypothetical protein